MTGEEHLHARILEQLDLTREVQDEELTQIIYQVLEEAGRQEYLPLDRKTALGRELFNAFRKLDLLEEFLEAMRRKVLNQSNPGGGHGKPKVKQIYGKIVAKW